MKDKVDFFCLALHSQIFIFFFFLKKIVERFLYKKMFVVMYASMCVINCKVRVFCHYTTNVNVAFFRNHSYLGFHIINGHQGQVMIAMS